MQTASELLRAVLAEEPDNFFAALELADALRLRYPRSPEAADRLRRARVLLERADVGAARARLSGYVDEALAAIDALGPPERCEPAAIRGELTDPALPPRRLAELAQPLLECGPGSAAALADALAGRPRGAADAALVLFLRAEALRGTAEPRAVQRLYRAAAARACAAADVAGRDETTCARAQMRLAELDRMFHGRPMPWTIERRFR